MPDITRIGISHDVVGPFVACRVCVARADVFRLQGFELLEGAEFVCHCCAVVVRDEGGVGVALDVVVVIVEEVVVLHEDLVDGD